jgi:hypothetical protein
MKYYASLYYFLNYLIYLLYFLTWFNLWAQAPQYLNLIHYFFQILIGFILVIFFNPFSNVKYEKIHIDVAFSAGIFLLTSTLLNVFYSLFYSYYKKLDKTMRDFINKILYNNNS